MRILIAAAGRFGGGRGKLSAEKALFEDYVRRSALAVTLKEVVEPGRLPPAIRRRREGLRLLAAVPRGATVVALDAGGTALSSADLARRLRAWQDGGIRDLAFVVGGTHGLDEPVLEKSDLVLSLGPMTWPHLLVRVMLAEQLFRAQCILGGHPYHHG